MAVAAAQVGRHHSSVEEDAHAMMLAMMVVVMRPAITAFLPDLKDEVRRVRRPSTRIRCPQAAESGEQRRDDRVVARIQQQACGAILALVGRGGR